MSEMLSWKQEFVVLWKYLQDATVCGSKSRLDKFANNHADLACLHTRFLLFLHGRDNGHLSFATFLSPRTGAFISPSP
jgi:hypothetical protein